MCFWEPVCSFWYRYFEPGAFSGLAILHNGNVRDRKNLPGKKETVTFPFLRIFPGKYLLLLIGRDTGAIVLDENDDTIRVFPVPAPTVRQA